MDSFLVTCEHGGNRVPAPCRRLFRGQQRLLDSHRGYDPGALVMAKALADALSAPLVSSTVSRLVIDLNRSIGHPRLWSSATRGAPRELRTSIVERHYRPYRAEVERLVRRSRVARSPRDPRLVAQLHAGAGRQGATRGRGVAVRPCPARRSPALCPVEGVARAHRAAGPGTPQLSLCRQGRWPDFGAARSLSPTAPTSGSSSRSISGSSSPRAGAGRRCAVR